MCKDFSKNHYKQFKEEKCWPRMQVSRKAELTINYHNIIEVNEIAKYLITKIENQLKKDNI